MIQTFKDIPVGDKFVWAGLDCIKQSTRTARLIKAGRVFYFPQNALVNR